MCVVPTSCVCAFTGVGDDEGKVMVKFHCNWVCSFWEESKCIFWGQPSPLNYQVRSDWICDLLQVPCKPVLTCFMVRLLATKPSPPPGFLVRRVFGYGHPAGLKTKPVKGRRSSLWANGHPFQVLNCVCGRPPAVGLLFLKILTRLVAVFSLQPP